MTRDRAFYKSFFKLFRMLVLQNVIVLSVNLADNIMIGSYSETALSGVAAVNQIQFLFQTIVSGCAEALVVLGSQYWGQNKTTPIKKAFSGAFLLAEVFAVVLFVLAACIPGDVVGLFSETDAIVESGVSYINVIKYTYPVFAATTVLLALLRTVETVKIAFYVSIMTLCTNVAINYTLIGGNFGAPALGEVGAAVGTLVARVLELIVVICYIIFKDKKLSFRFREMFNIDRVLFADYLRLSRSFVVVGALFGASTALQSVILGHMNDSAIAANSVATTLYQILKVAAIGAASAASVIIGKTVGTGNIGKVKEYSRTLQCMFVCIGLLTSAALFMLRIPILSLYDLSPETKAMANEFLLVLCVTCIGTAYQMPTCTGIIRGGGDANFVVKNDIISIWCIVIPVSFLAAFKFGAPPTAVVFLLNSDQIFKCAAAAIKVNRYNFIKKLTRDTQSE
ncbi:MAG: MATE family efflux transporter [Clostridia bacterium]|nr:MATE family efflux transporter [Clostridia bacterium]